MYRRHWPKPSLQHLCRLTDDCGVIQHAKFWSPDYEQGYCIDDNSRALIVAWRYHRLFNEDTARELMVRYLAFMLYAQRSDGKVHNFVDYSRAFLDEEGSLDSMGRSLWGLGHLATVNEHHLAIPAREMFHRLRVHLMPDAPPHSLAYAILGLCAYGAHDELHEEAGRLVRSLLFGLFEYYHAARTDDWDWFLPAVTYGNARLSQALLLGGRLLNDPELMQAGIRSLNFLNSVSYVDGVLAPIGCHGWFPRGGHRALFDQQPIDAGGMVEANLDAYLLTDDDTYFDYAVRAMDWFFGTNILNLPVYDVESNGCHDGLHSAGVNLNQGAESTLAYLMASLRMYEKAPNLFSDDTPNASSTCV